MKLRLIKEHGNNPIGSTMTAVDIVARRLIDLGIAEQVATETATAPKPRRTRKKRAKKMETADVAEH